jgi:hypothetical protein
MNHFVVLTHKLSESMKTLGLSIGMATPPSIFNRVGSVQNGLMSDRAANLVEISSNWLITIILNGETPTPPPITQPRHTILSVILLIPGRGWRMKMVTV